MLKIFTTLALVALASPALAQQQPNVAQEQVERMLGSLFVTNANLAAQAQSLQGELAAAKARIRDLETKTATPEPKKD